jgi:pimeloyl-ACP methyl ester carboxylesterase
MSLREQSISGATIDAGGISLKYFAAGIGEPVVLLHCTAGSGRQWADVAEALRSDFRVIAPDLCGYGGTTHWPGNGTFNLAVEADLVAALLDMLGKPAHIVGHSYGGAVALQFASRHPRYVKTLTLIEPASFHLLRDGDDIDERGFREISEIGNTVVNALNCGDYQGGMRRFVDYWGGDGAWDALPTSQQLALAARISKVALDFWATINDSMRQADLVYLEMPTLVVSGGRSPLPTRRICSHLARMIPDVTVRTVATAGHMLPFTHFKELVPLIVDHYGGRRGHRPGRSREFMEGVPA